MFGFLLASMVVGVNGAGGPPQYDLFEFGFEGPSWTTAFKFNDALDVSGSFGNPHTQAFIGRESEMMQLPSVGGYPRNVGVSIDSQRRVMMRTVVGHIYKLGVGQHVALWTRTGGAVDLHKSFMANAAKPAFGGAKPDKSEVFDANDLGDFVGWMSLGTDVFDPLAGLYVAYRANFEDGSFETLAVPSTLPSTFLDAQAMAVDADADVVGYAWERVIAGQGTLVFFRPRAVAWLDGVAIEVGSPDPVKYPFSSLTEITDDGRAIGMARPNMYDHSVTTGFVWDKHTGAFAVLPPAAGYTGSSASIAGVDLVFGRSLRQVGSQTFEITPTVWRAGQAYELASLVPQPGPWTLGGVSDADRHGRLLASAHQAPYDPAWRPVLLVPRSGLEVETPDPQIVGVLNVVRVHGATPGAIVELLASFAPTVQQLAGCGDPFAIVGVAERQLDIAPAIADDQGVAYFAFVPPPALGQVPEVLLQAIEPEECRTGSVLGTWFF